MGETVNTEVGHNEKVEKGLISHLWRLEEGAMSQGEWWPLQAGQCYEMDQTWVFRVERSPGQLDFSPLRSMSGS